VLRAEIFNVLLVSISFNGKNIQIQTFVAVNHYFWHSRNANLFKPARLQKKMTYWTVVGARRRLGMRRRRAPLQMTLKFRPVACTQGHCEST